IGRVAYYKAQKEALRNGALPWPTLPGHALGPAEGSEPRVPFFVQDGKIRKRVDLAPYVSGQRRA
ncbi:MAG: hypothetical protein AAFP22_21215, partial [Planctomycetota bacterium]